MRVGPCSLGVPSQSRNDLNAQRSDEKRPDVGPSRYNRRGTSVGVRLLFSTPCFRAVTLDRCSVNPIHRSQQCVILLPRLCVNTMSKREFFNS